jgi:hypothetical protein
LIDKGLPMHAGEGQPMAPLPVVVIPVDSDGMPILDQRCRGTATLQTSDRMAISLASRPEQPALVVGVGTEAGPLQYTGIDVRAVAVRGPGSVLVHGQVGGLADALLQPKNLTPRFHFDSMTFTFGFSPRLLHRWEEAGVLRSVVIDRLLLCPRCHGLPTFRHGCRHCGSGRVTLVASAGNGKARPDAEVPLIVSLDHQTHSAPVVAPEAPSRFPAYHCQDCHRSDTDLAPVHQCLHCDCRFAAQEAFEMVLRGYCARRLDLTAVPRTT